MKNIHHIIEQCPPGSVWTAAPTPDSEFHHSTQGVWPTGYADLDEALPEKGWAAGQINEILHAPAVGADVQLVAPALVQRQQQALRGAESPWAATVVVVNPVHPPFAPAWSAWGMDVSRLVWLHPERPQACAWAVEQALQCADVVAVLAWLPQANALALRRIQYFAAQSEALMWLFRPQSCQVQASPAPLRLAVDLSASQSASPALQVQVLKRRGQPRPEILQLPWWHGDLSHAMWAQQKQVAERRDEALEYADECRALDGADAFRQAA